MATIPASAITQSNGQPALWVRSSRRAPSRSATVELTEVAVHGYRNDEVLVSGLPAGELVVTAGVQKMAPGLRVALPGAAAQRSSQAGRPMKSFNLTEWALNHRAIVLFLILVIAIGGVLGFTKLGQLEDPNFSVPSMTAMVIWPGATAQQIQDEVLNRMEKKFEQLDHFEKVKTYARQGYGAMLITVVGGTSHADQREAWYQARKKFSDIKLELPEGVIGPIFNDEFGDVTGLLYAVKGDGVSLAELSDVIRGHQAPPAQGADGEEGRHLRQAGEEGLRRVLAPAAGRARHHAAADCREPEKPEQRAGERLDRHAQATACWSA